MSKKSDDVKDNITTIANNTCFISTPSLVPAILDAFSDLNVAQACLREICDHVLSQLGSYSTACLPIVIKFLMQQGGGADGMDVNALTANMIADSSTMHTASTNNGHQNAHRRGAETTVIKLASTGRLTAEVDAAMPVLLLSLAPDDPKLLHPFALMLNGILDCLGNPHFIHIRQLFRILTTLTFDRQRTAAAGLRGRWCLSQFNEELKCIGTIAAITVTRTWLALANAADISIDGNHLSSLLQALQLIYADNTNSHQEQAHLSGCVNGHSGLTIDHRCRRPFGFRSLADPGMCEGRWNPKRTLQHDNTRQHDCGLRRRTGVPQTRVACSNVSPEDTRAREVGKGTHVVVSQKTLQAPVRDEAAAAVGDCRRVRGHDAQQDRRGDKIAKTRCRNADLSRS
ncbi:hypothetical protein PTSG_02557 [Salpingoeca rosetta]|uniref:Uncharacterized protein n=1 Tax=Salpingoeca rosetta (strain ATCC 50818 / BSB-021) TaxID=946362 RepID=F2U2J0_SALR5|nr:uncharacterized protein PTSG_02557 [Salpingoeca rosetta]EGD81842.1 hypothetical protein PTSG_02557 [Salpingoeca rosetta]|eukprot:XP_004997046.1 hypothetical protein PTSG_02557 [Salpingoeca rosetta]